MDQKSENFLKSTMTSGAVLGLALILHSVVLYTFDATLVKGMNFIGWAIIVAGIVYGTKNFRDNFQNGIISYGRALGTGTIITVFAGFIQGFYMYIFVNYIDIEYFDRLIEQTVILYQEGGLTDEQIEASLEMSEIMRTPVALALSTIFVSAFLGFIISLLTSIFLKKEGDGFEQAMNQIKEN